MSNNKKISRQDFLKMTGIAGTSFLLLPLIPLGKVMGTRVTNQNKPVIIKRTNIVGPEQGCVSARGLYIDPQK